MEALDVDGKHKSYESDIFDAGDYKWKLILYPYGNNTCEGKDKISLYLVIDESNSLFNDNRTVCVDFKLFVLNQKTMKYLTIQYAKGAGKKLSLWPKGNHSQKGKSIALFLWLQDQEYIVPERKVYAKYKIRLLDHSQVTTVERKDTLRVKNDTLTVEVEVDVISVIKWFNDLVIRSVVWSPPAPGCIKVNTDGSALGSSSVGGCGGVFQTYRSFVKACFAVPLGQVFAFEAELFTASLAINYDRNLGWHRIWLESDSSYVMQLLSVRSDQVTWCVHQAWQRCLHQISHMEFQVSHIFREGNQ
ncbi:hypothetical protein Ddye_024086 [Dipteronia dyeriana]|uniref:MATH domain-containing protein n=1 Tax=Dipteronia dyeriana TaxID=168575 RepID=A0AAD9TV71_9ROSI|nr:hypothetical protein Ddye_024086 [Dipteronia dyeriana]